MNTQNSFSPKKQLDRFLSKQFSSDMFTYQEIFKMLFPLILDMFFINVISMLTTSMISSSSEASVAAVSMINPVTTLVLCLLNAIAAGGTVVVAQYKGKGNQKKIREACGHTLLVTIGISLIICALLIAFASPIVHVLYGNAEPLVVSKSIQYLSGVSVSLIFYSLYSAVFAIFRGLGETKICLRLTIYINVSYFIFSFIFINILHWDIMGTILALLFARLLGSAMSAYHLFIKKNRLLYLQKSDILRFDASIFHSMLKISIPFGSEQLFLYGGSILVQKYLVELGTASIAANAIATSLFGLSYAAPYAVGNLATTVIGQCIGAGKKDLAKWYGKKLIYLGTALVLVSLVVFIPLMPWLLTTYHPSAQAVELIMHLLWIAIIPMPFFWAMSNIMPYTLRSAGDAVYSSVVSLVTMWLIRVGAGYLAAIPMGYGVEGAWVCMSLEWVVRCFLFLIRFKGTAWLNQKTID